MSRTVVNVSGDLTAACVVGRWERAWSPARLDRAEPLEAFEESIAESPTPVV